MSAPHPGGFGCQAVNRSKVVVLLLFIHCLLGLSVSFLFCFAIISLGKRELVDHFCCVLNAMSLLSFFDSSSLSYGLVCSMRLWHLNSFSYSLFNSICLIESE